MPDYSKGKIYTIRFHNDDNHIYIGSTTQDLYKRFADHKIIRKDTTSITNYVNDKYNGDWSNCYIELLENFKCDNKEQLTKREGELIRQYKNNDGYIVINRCIAGRTQQEYIFDNRYKISEWKATYRANNQDKIAEYYQANKNKIAKHRVGYYQANKDKLKDRCTEYYYANKTKRLEYQTEYNANKRIIQFLSLIKFT